MATLCFLTFKWTSENESTDEVLLTNKDKNIQIFLIINQFCQRNTVLSWNLPTLTIPLIVLLLQVVQDILEHEREFVKDLQTVLSCYLRPLQASDK